jgi:hypothetical protein
VSEGSWLRRTSLRVRIAAGVVAAAVIAAVAFVAVPSSAPPPKPAYASLPAACDLVSLATVAKYLPNPTPTPESEASGVADSTYTSGACKWASATNGEDRTLVTQVLIFKAPSAIMAAQQSYNGSVSLLGCHCRGVAVSMHSVTGLGDQAAAFFITASPAATIATAPNAGAPGVNLLVRSSNAEIALNYEVTAPATGTPVASAIGTAPLNGMISMARGILAALAHPAAVASAPVPSEPHYTGSRDPCLLITMATLAKYAPGTVVTPSPLSGSATSSASPRLSQCAWGSTSTFVSLTLWSFPDAASARQGFDFYAQANSRSSARETVSGSVWMPDLGEAAAAIFLARSGAGRGVDMLVWSGNVEIDLWYSYLGSVAPDRAALLAGGIAMTRDVLAALARPTASSQPHGPVYTSPRDPCALIKASTLARYAPGASASLFQTPGGAGPQVSDCSWIATDGTLLLSVSIYADPDGALGGYEYDVQNARQSPNGNVFDGAQPVKGLGDQAIAIFETSQSQGAPDVYLDVLSGNAEIDLSFSDLPFGPTPSRAQKLAADIAMIRDVLADLPR